VDPPAAAAWVPQNLSLAAGTPIPRTAPVIGSHHGAAGAGLQPLIIRPPLGGATVAASLKEDPAGAGRVCPMEPEPHVFQQEFFHFSFCRRFFAGQPYAAGCRSVGP
jgi:hypothetical protein